MIFVEGWVRTAPGALEHFLPAAKAMVEASRKEAGCLDYAYARDLFEPELLWVSERWADETALAVHFQTPHMAAFNQALAALDIAAASVQVYSGAHVRPMIER